MSGKQPQIQGFQHTTEKNGKHVSEEVNLYFCSKTEFWLLSDWYSTRTLCRAVN